MSLSIFDSDGDIAARQRPYGMIVGIAVSLALHALLIYGYRGGWAPPLERDNARPVEALTVWIRPAPRPEPTPTPAPARRLAPAPRKPAPKKTPARTAFAAPPTLISLPAPSSAAAPGAPDARDPFAEPAPKFDMEAARQTARKVAGERDPGKAGTALGQIPEPPLPTETKLARDIAQAKRGNCKDGVPGGLLAPLLLMLDKKDSGCKW